MIHFPKLPRAGFKILTIVLLSLIIAAGINTTDSLAFSDPAFNSLNSQVNNLRVRISRLESEIRNINRNLRLNAPNRPTSPQIERSSPQRDIESDDAMFKRLATLVIELKEDVRDLDDRLKKLENIIY